MNRNDVVLIMGVSGSGKTTIGTLLAGRLGIRFMDGDDLHPDGNVSKMASGLPLNDEDRRPWLEAIRAVLQEALDDGSGLVVACSALRQSYRDHLIRPGEPIRLVFLDGPESVIERRLRDRAAHFMPAGLLQSQFEVLEIPSNALVMDVRRDPDSIVDDLVRAA